MFGFSSEDSRRREFWKWFAKNEVHFRDFTTVESHRLAQIGKELRRVHPDLTFEIEPGILTISADGVGTLFPAVRRLVASAPPLRGWSIVAFRQPSDLAMELQIGQITVRMNDVKVLWKENNGKWDIAFLFPGYDTADRNDWLAAAFVLLDSTLGEETVVTKIADIRMFDISEAPGRGQPLSALSALLGR